MSSAEEQVLRNGKTRQTGTFLSEFYEPFLALRERGYVATIATPSGARPAIDPEGQRAEYWPSEATRNEAEEWTQHDSLFNHPIDLSEALRKLARWDAVIVPGGQGVMLDVVPDPRVHELVLALAQKGRPVGLICHSPALLKHLPSTDDNPLLGRAVTSVSPLEEFYIETFIMKGKAIDRRIGRQLKKKGYRYRAALPKRDHAIADCNLVTSQNPYSGASFVREFSKALNRYEKQLTCPEPS